MKYKLERVHSVQEIWDIKHKHSRIFARVGVRDEDGNYSTESLEVNKKQWDIIEKSKEYEK